MLRKTVVFYPEPKIRKTVGEKAGEVHDRGKVYLKKHVVQKLPGPRNVPFSTTKISSARDPRPVVALSHMDDLSHTDDLYYEDLYTDDL